MEQVVESIELLLLIAALVAMLARKFHIPYTVGLLAAGLGLALTTEPIEIRLSKELLFSALLPPLIFEAAFYIRWPELRRDLVPTLTLATIGVAGSALIAALGMFYFVGWDWSSALLFGAMICATDPVSVIATFKDAGVHGRLRLLVEAESILNDGTAAVLFGVVIVTALGADLSALSCVLTLLREVGGGLLIGCLMGAAILWIAGKTEDHLVEITFTTIAAYGSFLFAQKLHCSGVISTLASGLILGNWGSIRAFSPRGREAIQSFWEYAAFVANSLVFLLIGAQVAREHLLGILPVIFIAYVLSLLSRALPVYALSEIFRGSDKEIPRKHQHILVWGGLRGALTLALALGLPPELPHRSEIVAVVFGTVALSIVLQGLTMPRLLRTLHLI